MPVLEDETHDSPVHRMRHSFAHVMAQAVQQLFPGTKLGFGPPTEDGFFYDFLLPRSISEADFPAIEERMRTIIAERQGITREDLPLTEAFGRIEEMGEPYKLEYARELVEKQSLDSLSFYSNGHFTDMCEGPHVENTAELPRDGFKLHSIAGAYWRGDERNQMMTRIYAYAFPTRKEVATRVAAVEQAKQHDHRKLGAQLGIFVIRDEVGKGLPLWLPNGAVLRRELEKLAYEMEFKEGYRHVATPHIARQSLYQTSGHLALYGDAMYPPMKVQEEGEAGGDLEWYYLRPMNCPHHHMIFDSEQHSYRDLPLRLSEYGSVYRFERAGALQGLTRVRGMTMNDAHIYVTPEQLKEEFKSVMRLHAKYYEMFGFTNYHMRLSLWDKDDPKRRSKYVDDPEAWDYTERIVQEALEEMGSFYKLSRGEAAFYGPKVDFQFKTVLGREFTLSTNQIDFAVPARFNLHYTDKDGTQQMPYVIHRAPLGTHERFVAFLIEHYGGAFPTWLAPVQALVLPISEKFNDYARKVEATLRELLIRAEIDDSTNTTGKKIREAVSRKIPIILVVGANEETEGTVTVRRYGIQEQRAMPLDIFVNQLQAEIRERKHVKEW
ncbi:MAG: threonyl-tRNA synthetase [Acidobacteriota bacterium]|jgi:threonyl-tRNA synthetase|nr:threonyl-tRNA synthetase [Acidobacteriota bacterium]MDT7781302.1 threonyl-tRNA synthetase [Acidobacteriota bacterium]